MNVGMIGMGKLGLSCALAMDSMGHKVYGYDVSAAPYTYVEDRKIPFMEEHVDDLLQTHGLMMEPYLGDVVRQADIVFAAVQTPHAEGYEGITPVPDELRDFDYSYLVTAVEAINKEADEQERDITLVVISTVLPGTMERLIKPILGDHIKLVYNPFFIAMGTTVDDFLNPEFVLLGCDDFYPQEVVDFYNTIHEKECVVMSVASAELTKVAYNTFIGLKITFVNSLMEICEKLKIANVDDVTDALIKATDRVISPKYMRAGMGDGGGCHPRDNIALSWLALNLDLSFDIFGTTIAAREAQTKWMAEQIAYWKQVSGKQVMIMGLAYKPETNLTIGSPALLLIHYLEEMGIKVKTWDPIVNPNESDPRRQMASRVAAGDNAGYLYVIATAHEEFFTADYPRGSTVIDPWGRVPEQKRVLVVRLGRKW